jgi:hypothetical protein
MAPKATQNVTPKKPKKEKPPYQHISRFPAGWAPDLTPRHANEHVFTVGGLFCGIGAGILGYLQSKAQLGDATARFVSVGGVDLDGLACDDFEMLTDSPALQADIVTLTPEALRAAWGEKAPDVVFHSSPCVGLS